MNTTGDVVIATASPAAAATTYNASPVITPRVAGSSARAPPRMPHPSTNNMSGPGVTRATMVVAVKTVEQMSIDRHSVILRLTPGQAIDDPSH